MKAHLGFLFALALLAACTPGGTNPPPGIGSSGGTITTDNVTITAPPGAFSADSGLAITSATPNAAPPSGKTIVPGTAFTLSGNAEPSQALTVKITYDANIVSSLRVKPLAEPSSLALYQLVAGAWQLIQGSSVDEAQRIVTALVNKLGVYALFVTPKSNPTTPTVASVVLTSVPTSTQITVGQTLSLFAAARDSSGATIGGVVRYAWTSSNTGVGTLLGSISGQEVLTAVSPGTTTITASSGGVTSNALTITVVPATPTGGLMPKSYTVEPVTLPTGTQASATAPLALNNNGAVLLRSLTSGTTGTGYIISGTTTTQIPLPANYQFFIAAQFGRPCLTDNGTAAFAANYTGSGGGTQSMYFDGSSTSKIAFPGDTGNTNDGLIRGCAGDGTLIGLSKGAGPSAGAYVWRPGQSTATATDPLASPTDTGRTGILSSSRFTPAAGGTSTVFPGVQGSIITGLVVINDAGQAAGVTLYAAPNPPKLTLWTPGQTPNLVDYPSGFTNGGLAGINNGGEVIGKLLGSDFTTTKYFFYNAGGFKEIVTTGWTIQSITDINNNGLILASATQGSSSTEVPVILRPN
jgi:hypothetical protein